MAADVRWLGLVTIVALALVARGAAVALAPVASPTAAGTAEPSVTERVLDLLAGASRPLSIRALREHCRVRNTRICQALAELTAAGRVRRSADGYKLVASAAFPALARSYAASMGPRRFSRGETATSSLLAGFVGASMGPRLFSRGKLGRDADVRGSV